MRNETGVPCALLAAACLLWYSAADAGGIRIGIGIGIPIGGPAYYPAPYYGYPYPYGYPYNPYYPYRYYYYPGYYYGYPYPAYPAPAPAYGQPAAAPGYAAPAYGQPPTYGQPPAAPGYGQPAAGPDTTHRPMRRLELRRPSRATIRPRATNRCRRYSFAAIAAAKRSKLDGDEREHPASTADPSAVAMRSDVVSPVALPRPR